MRAIPRPEVQVEERPESSATCRTYQPRRKSSAATPLDRRTSVDRLAVDAYAVEQRDAGVAVLADHPRLDAAGGDAELVADRRAQPQRVVGGVAEHAPAVEHESRLTT